MFGLIKLTVNIYNISLVSSKVWVATTWDLSWWPCGSVCQDRGPTTQGLINWYCFVFTLWWPVTVTECLQNMIYIYICQLWQLWLWPCYGPGVLGGDRGKHVSGVQHQEQCPLISISWTQAHSIFMRKVEVGFCWNPFKEWGTVGNVQVWKICMFNCLWSPAAALSSPLWVFTFPTNCSS